MNFAALDGRRYTHPSGRDPRLRATVQRAAGGGGSAGVHSASLDGPARPRMPKTQRPRSRATSRPGSTASSVWRRGSKRPASRLPFRSGSSRVSCTRLSEGDRLCPAKSTLLGACKVLPQEFPNLHWKTIDIGDWAQGPGLSAAERIVAELADEPADPVVAYRDGQRWVQEFVPSPLGEAPQESTRLRAGRRLSDHRRSREHRPRIRRGACSARPGQARAHRTFPVPGAGRRGNSG